MGFCCRWWIRQGHASFICGPQKTARGRGVAIMESKSTGRNLGGEPLHGLRGRSSFFVVAGLCLVSLSGVARAQTCPTTPCAQASDCNDGKFCTTDSCIGVSCFCSHNDNQCNDGIVCDGDNYCDTVTDSCKETSPVQCNAPQFCSEVFGRCVDCETNAQCTSPRPWS